MKTRRSASGRVQLREIGEDRLLELLLPSLPGNGGVVAKAGDDCAVVRPPRRDSLLLLKSDSVVEKVHFAADADPAAVGWKAVMRALSDFAAASGVPQFALVSLMVPATRTLGWVRHLYRGMTRAAKRFDVAIVGGETSNTRGPAAIAISVVGFVEKNRYVGRSGGKPGDDLFVTGRLGGSIRGKHLSFVPRISESRWLTQNCSIHAMMDLSDGLGADLPRLSKASRVGFEIDEAALPRNPGCSVRDAIANGEDYELVFAVSPRDSERLQRAWRRKFPKLKLTRIGRLTPQSAIRNPRFFRGYVHFK